MQAKVRNRKELSFHRFHSVSANIFSLSWRNSGKVLLERTGWRVDSTARWRQIERRPSSLSLRAGIFSFTQSSPFLSLLPVLLPQGSFQVSHTAQLYLLHIFRLPALGWAARQTRTTQERVGNAGSSGRKEEQKCCQDLQDLRRQGYTDQGNISPNMDNLHAFFFFLVHL